MISLTLSRALSQPGMKPQAAPHSIPATSMTAIVTGREAVSGTSPDRITALAPSAPI
jgi:hypothetical protein